jgi:hypothetical protein
LMLGLCRVAKIKNERFSGLFGNCSTRLGIINYTAQYEGWFGQLSTPARYE